MPRFLSGRVGRALLLGLAVSLGVSALSRVGALAGWETRAVDTFLALRDRGTAPDLVIVPIDDAAFRELGERQPLSRRYLADLTGLLVSSGARVVAFDVQFRAPTTAQEDAALLAVAWRAASPGATRLVWATVAEPRPGGVPTRYEMGSLFSPALGGLVGFANAPVGPDGVIRRLDAVLPAERGWLPSLALAVLAAHAGLSPAGLADALKDDRPLDLPVRSPGRPIEGTAPVRPSALGAAAWRIDFVGGAGAVTAIPAGPLVALARGGVKPDTDNPFRGKIVLVGATFPESRDHYPTPVGLMAGVEIHANILETLLSRRTLLPPPMGLNLAVLAGACLAVALLSAWLRPLWVAVASAALIALFAAVSYEAYARGGYWLDFVAPVTGMLAYMQGARILERRRLRRTFGEFVSPEVVAQVARDGAALGGELRMVSVLMSDVRGFTAMAERLPPAEVSETMNEYFTAMVDVILTRRGMVQDFIGDGILAVFGAPVDDAEHPMQAVRAALEMQAALERLNARWKAAGRSPLAIGAAVHTGPAFAGYLGSPRKKKYGVLGDTVNTTSRIEGLNRELGTTILLSAATHTAVGARVTVRSRGAVPVKGKAEPVEVYEVVGLAGEPEVREATGRLPE